MALGKSTAVVAARNTVPSAATRLTTVTRSKPPPVRVRVVSTPLPPWSGVTPVRNTSAVVATSVKLLGLGTTSPYTRMNQVPAAATGTSTC